jgi:hypothetical protein
MILHYICRHRYRPPDAFCDAVLRCLPIGSRAYFEALGPAVTDVETSDFSTWVDQRLVELDLLRQIASFRNLPDRTERIADALAMVAKAFNGAALMSEVFCRESLTTTTGS